MIEPENFPQKNNLSARIDCPLSTREFRRYENPRDPIAAIDGLQVL
jgi:hypothetical protein